MRKQSAGSAEVQHDHALTLQSKLARFTPPAAQRFRMFHTVGFQGDHEHALMLICLVLKQLGFQWSYTKDKKLKCRIDFEKESLQDDETFIQNYLNRKFLKFNISIYKEPTQSRSVGASNQVEGSLRQNDGGLQLNPKQANFLINV